MAPRSGKKKYRARNPIPVWLPLPRPCLRSLNMPGHPYYLPIAPEMYLPPWTLPPPYFSKPMCHCANENLCTTSNCRHSAECLKMHPMFCPYGTNNEDTLHLQRNLVEQQNSDQETSSNSDINICSACGAPSNKSRTSENKKNSNTAIRTQDPSHNVIQSNQESAHIDSGKKIESDPISPEIIRSKEHNCLNSSCQTIVTDSRPRGSNRLNPQKKYRLNSPNKNKRYSLDSSTDQTVETSHTENVSIPVDTSGSLVNGIQNEFGCISCAGQENGQNEDLDNGNTNSMSQKEQTQNLVGTTGNMAKLHVNQIPENISNARKTQTNKYSGCCKTGSKKNCKTDIDIDTMGMPNADIAINNQSKITRSSKISDCTCYTGNTPKTLKLSDCLCSTTNTSLKESSRFRKKSKCECSHKVPHKNSSRSHKFSECGCSTAKIQKNYPRKVSECSFPADVPHKILSKNLKSTQNEFSTADASKISSTKLLTKESKKSLRDTASMSETIVKKSNCQCKFPPAYKHLSCTGNKNNNCSCSAND